ncbi:MAG: FAD binding domain-containing protein [Anaerolineae bacterium]
MKPPPFQYYAPTTVEEALTHLAEHGYDAKVLAGGQSLIPTMNFRLAQPAVLVDLNPVSELFYIRPDDDGGVRIGAMTRQSQVERDPLVAERAPLIHETIPHIAHPQIRNRGTFGGNIAHNDPASELPAVTTALNARLRLQSQAGERWVSADEFFLGLFYTALEPEEMLVEVALPAMPPRSGWAFREMSRRPGDYALVGVTAVVTLDGNERCQAARLVFFGVGEGPAPAHQAADVLAGESPTPQVLRAAAETAASTDIDPSSDVHASAEFRRHLAKVLARQALEEAFGRAGGRS